MTGLRIVHLAPGHVALDARVFHKEARTLASAGHDVVVVGRHQREEVVDQVHLVPLPRPRSRWRRFVLGQWRLISIARRLDGDVYQVHDFDAIPAGLIMRLRGRHLVYDSHEDYPRLARSRPWIPDPVKPLVSAAVRAVEWLVARASSAVISAEEEGAKRFPPHKTTVVRNYVLDEEFEALDPSRSEREGRRLIYVGAMSRERGVVDAVSALPESVDGRPVELVLLGDLGPLRAELEALPQWSQVVAPGFADREEVVRQLLRADVGLLLWHDTPKHAEGAVPVKLFEYMAAGLPVIASALGPIEDVVVSGSCGMLIDASDHDQVRRAVVALLSDPERAAHLGANGRVATGNTFLWSSQAAELVGVYSINGFNRLQR